MPLFIIKNIIKSEYKFILIYIVNTSILIVLFNQLLDTMYISYPVLLSIVFLLVYILIKYISYTKIYKNIENNKISNYEAKYNKEFKDDLYLDVIKDLHFDYNRKINRILEKNKSSEILFSQFIHNMKTSVSVIELASTSGIEKLDIKNKDILIDIKKENMKLKEQLEQSLNILRLEEFSQDYVPQKHDLLEIVQSVINENKTIFIYSGIIPKVIGKSVMVMTDKKWCKYIINQVLSNSIKYSKNDDMITFDIENNAEKVILKIIDKGVGIPSKDIDRVFEMFYTGSNGRDNCSSTGIGLTMVKKVASLLSHEIKLYSKVDIGTTFEITFLTKM